MRGWVRIAALAVAGTIAGAAVTLALQTSTVDHALVLRTPAPAASGEEAPTTYLAWVPRGLPAGLGDRVADLRRVAHVAVVAEEVAWLRRSWSNAGELVDDPPRPYRIPLDTAAVDPEDFGRFLETTDRAALTAVANGQGILGATSASLRGLGPGAMLELEGGVRIRIAAVLPDALVGAAELVVSRATGQRIGVERERYLLLRPVHGWAPTAKSLKHLLRPLLPAELGVNRRLQIRTPGDTPFFRAGDAVLPPVLVKAVFGEFSARLRPRHPGELSVDPAWVRDHIVTVDLPVIGTVTCHRGLVPQLRGAMQELASLGLQRLVRSYHGCFVPRFIGRDDGNMLSNHSWGVAFDVNLTGNLRGQIPHQDDRLVEVLERRGFVWGGTWLVPDGNHFEYHRTPD